MKITVRPPSDAGLKEQPDDNAFITKMTGEPDELAFPVYDKLDNYAFQAVTVQGDRAVVSDAGDWHSAVRFIPVRIVEIVVEEL